MNDQLPPPHATPALPRRRGELRAQAFNALPYEAAVEEEESALRRYWRILVKRRHIIFVGTALGVLAGLLISMVTRSEYAGTVTIQVAREEAKVFNNIEGVEQPNIGARSDAEFYQTQYALLKSRSLSERVVRDLGLADNYLFLANFKPRTADGMRKLSRERRFAMAT
ncbi:MAG TPA: Wzz/FepE/Etk N-terminal domain-containing protein, partial [Bradyrhizobium sp.]|nr:Wzz/FepE/Etk N-terminal domain-containing protein [Bradyrhizobium sp.]